MLRMNGLTVRHRPRTSADVQSQNFGGNDPEEKKRGEKMIAKNEKALSQAEKMVAQNERMIFKREDG